MAGNIRKLVVWNRVYIYEPFGSYIESAHFLKMKSDSETVRVVFFGLDFATKI